MISFLIFFFFSSQLNGLDDRENLARDLGITEEGTAGGPLLLEVVRMCQQKKISGNEEVSAVNVFSFFIILYFYFIDEK